MRDKFLLTELPNYIYPLNLACPECYRPLDSRKRADGRCDRCLHDKRTLPVNYIHVKKRNDEDEDDEYRAHRYNEDEN